MLKFSAEACAILHSLCWSWQNQQACHFSSLLSDSCSVFATLSSPPSFLLPQTLWPIWQELSALSFCSIRLNGSTDTHFSWGTTQLMSWPDGDCYLHPPQSLGSLSPLISRIHSCLSSDWRHTGSSKFFNR